MTFASFSLSPKLLANLSLQGYQTPTPIQLQAIPVILQGHDVLGLARTGTGKTAAFALPILDKYLKIHTNIRRDGPLCLVLVPTRELALQVAESFASYAAETKIQVSVVFGGVGIHKQILELRRKPEIVVATPGRLLDLMGQGEISLSAVDTFVLDEADRMFDMGFILDIKNIIAKLPAKRQNLLFSATMPKEIEGLAQKLLRTPTKIEVHPESSVVPLIQQESYYVPAPQKNALLLLLLENSGTTRAIVFTRMKHRANRVSDFLNAQGVSSRAFHSNKSQSARQAALGDFKQGKVKVLVATDIAARGLDVDDVEVVVNYDMPEVPETYVHRIGRSGRAGKEGLAWNLVDNEQEPLLQEVLRRTKCRPKKQDLPKDLDAKFATLAKSSPQPEERPGAAKQFQSRFGARNRSATSETQTPRNFLSRTSSGPKSARGFSRS